jgi:1,2-diacylglycerol 3-beta-glucosyltransferase
MVNGLLLAFAVLNWSLAAYAGLFSVYMLWILLGAWLARPEQASLTRHPSFIVIVPAHNEEQGIAGTIRQIRQVDYPPDKIRIVVIADNCSDRTAELAEQAGAEVLRRSDLVNRGKGQALGWVLRENAQLFDARDLIAFIDADMSVHPDFFLAMARKFEGRQSEVAQGRYVVSNPERGVLSSIGLASFCYVNHVRPAGRCFWGGTADLKGTGMVFRTAFLLPRGWNAHSIAEDIQLGKQLLLEGVRVMYVPDARVESDIPRTLAQVKVQQARWEGGKREVVAGLMPRTFRALVRTPSVALLDGLLDMLVPPLSVVILLNGLGLMLSWWLESGAWLVFGASILVFAAAVLTGLIQNAAPAGVYLRLASAPLFVVWKLALLVRLAIAPAQATWNRTPRDRPSRDETDGTNK